MPQREYGATGGAWPWLLQRVSAGFLLVLIFAHLWVEHFMHLGAAITFASVEARLMHALFAVIDYGLLIVVVFHGLNGLRTVLLEMPFLPHRVRTITMALWLLGILTVVFGMDILAPFLWGRPWFVLG